MKFIFRFLVLSLFVFLLAACSAAPQLTQTLNGLPDEGRMLVLILVTAGVTWVLLKLSIVFKVDLSGYANVVALALAPILVTIIEVWLKVIPSAFDNIILTIIHLIVLAVGAVGTFFLFQRRTPSIR